MRDGHDGRRGGDPSDLPAELHAQDVRRARLSSSRHRLSSCAVCRSAARRLPPRATLAIVPQRHPRVRDRHADPDYVGAHDLLVAVRRTSRLHRRIELVVFEHLSTARRTWISIRSTARRSTSARQRADDVADEQVTTAAASAAATPATATGRPPRWSSSTTSRSSSPSARRPTDGPLRRRGPRRRRRRRLRVRRVRRELGVAELLVVRLGLRHRRLGLPPGHDGADGRRDRAVPRAAADVRLDRRGRHARQPRDGGGLRDHARGAGVPVVAGLASRQRAPAHRPVVHDDGRPRAGRLGRAGDHRALGRRRVRRVRRPASPSSSSARSSRRARAARRGIRITSPSATACC